MERRAFMVSAATAFLYGTALYAGIRIKDDREWEWDVLNEEISLPSGILRRKQILDYIEKATGYRVFVKVDELDLKKRFVDMNEFKTVGDVLSEILAGEDAVVDVKERRHLIKIVHPKYLYVDLPNGWDLAKTKKELERLFPDIPFYITGNRIVAYGTEKQMKKVAPVVKKLVQDAFAAYDLEISVYPYCTKDPDKFFLGKRKYYGSEEYGPVKRTFVRVRHGDRVAVSFGGLNLSFSFDAQNREISYGNMKIPFYALKSVGFVITADGNGGVLEKLVGSSPCGNRYIITMEVLRNGLVL